MENERKIKKKSQFFEPLIIVEMHSAHVDNKN